MTMLDNAADWTRFWSRQHDEPGTTSSKEARTSSTSLLGRLGLTTLMTTTTHLQQQPRRRSSSSAEDSSWKRSMPNHHSKAVLLSKILSHPTCRAEFRLFLSKEFSSESLDFLESVESLRSLILLSDEKEALSVAGVMYRTFIANGGTKEITISSALRRSTTTAYENFSPRKLRRGNTATTPFDEAQREVERLLELDSLDRFLSTVGGRYSRLVLQASPTTGLLLAATVAKYKPGQRWVNRFCELTVHSLIFYHPSSNNETKKNNNTRKEIPLESVAEISDASVDVISAASRHDDDDALPPPNHAHILQLKVNLNRSRKVIKLAVATQDEKMKWLDMLGRSVSVAKDLFRCQSNSSASSSADHPTTSSSSSVILRSAQNIIAALRPHYHHHHHHNRSLSATSPPSPPPRQSQSPPPPPHAVEDDDDDVVAPASEEVKQEETHSPPPPGVPESRSDPGQCRISPRVAPTTNTAVPLETLAVRKQARGVVGRERNEAEQGEEDAVYDQRLARLQSGVSARTVEDVMSRTATRDRCRELCLGLAPVLLAQWSREIVATLDFVCRRPTADEQPKAQFSTRCWYDAAEEEEESSVAAGLLSTNPVALTVDLSIRAVPSLFWLVLAAKDRMTRGGTNGGLSDNEDDSTVGGGSSTSVVVLQEASPPATGGTSSASVCSSKDGNDDERRRVVAAELDELVSKLEHLVDLRMRGRRHWNTLRENLKAATNLCREDSWQRVSFTIQRELLNAAYFLEILRTQSTSSSRHPRETATQPARKKVAEAASPPTSRHELREQMLREFVFSPCIRRSSAWHKGLQSSARRLELFVNSRGCTQAACKLCDFGLANSRHGPVVVAVQPRAEEGKRIAGWLHGKCARCQRCGLPALRLPPHWWSPPPKPENTFDQVHFDADGRVVCGKCVEEADLLLRSRRSDERGRSSTCASFDPSETSTIAEESGSRLDLSSSSSGGSTFSPYSSSSEMSLAADESARTCKPNLHEEEIIRRRVERRLKYLRSFDWGSSSESLTATPPTCLVDPC